MKKITTKIFLVLSILMLALTTLAGCGKNAKSSTPEFSDEIMFTLRIYEPWIYESLHYTLLSDGTLIVLYYNTELGREQLSDERMNEFKKIFSPDKVYKMNVGEEDERTDGISRYIILYDSDGNEIEIGGYEVSSNKFQRLFQQLYDLCEDDYTKQFSDILDECVQNDVPRDEKLSLLGITTN